MKYNITNNKFIGGKNMLLSKFKTYQKIDVVPEIKKGLSVEGIAALEYLERYPQYYGIIYQAYQYRSLLKNNKGFTVPLLIFIEGQDVSTTKAERMTILLLKEIYEQFSPNASFLFVEAESIFNKTRFSSLSALKEIRAKITNSDTIFNEFVEFEDISFFMEELSVEDKERFKWFCIHLMRNSTVIIKGKKSDLQKFSLFVGKEENIYLDMTMEYSNEELAERIRAYFEKYSIFPDRTWDSHLLNELNQIKETKNTNLYTKIITRIKRELISKRTGSLTSDISILDEKDNEESLLDLNSMIGLENVKTLFHNLTSYLEFNQQMKEFNNVSYPLNLHMLFTGSPGTGKTTMARIVAKTLYDLGYIAENKLVEIDAKDMVSQWVGDTALKTNTVIRSAMGGVLFIDEAYSMIKNAHGHEAVATLIKAMADMKENLVVIFAGYQKEMEEFVKSNPGIASRIGYTFEFTDYSEEELIQMLKFKLKSYHLSITNEYLEGILPIIRSKKKELNFGNGRFIDNLIQSSLFKHSLTVKERTPETMFVLDKSSIPEM